MRHIISVILEDEAGALSRVSGLFTQRGFNIESLTVAQTTDPTLSRMTIVSSGSERFLELLVKQLNQLFDTFVFNILGLQEDQDTKGNDLTKEVMNIILQLRGNAKANKDWTSADLIRDELKKLNIEVRDGSDGSSWEVKN